MVETVTSYRYFDTIIYMYRASLGDFDTNDYNAIEGRYQLWAAFLLCTLVLQVILLNMLIALMGDTFGRVFEKKHIYTITNQTTHINDFLGLVTLTKTYKDHRFAYIVTPLEGDANDGSSVDAIQARLESDKEELNGRLNEIERLSIAHFNDLRALVKSQVKKKE